MNWMKIAQFILFFIIGAFAFAVIGLFMPYGLSPTGWLVFLVAYAAALASAFKQFNKRKTIALVAAFAILYVFIMVVQFPKCSVGGGLCGQMQECTCIGVTKHLLNLADYRESQCIGMPTKFVCTSFLGGDIFGGNVCGSSIEREGPCNT